MNFKVFHINAFVTESFLGNPACVIPLKSWPSSSKMLAIAKKNNVSETAFYIKKQDKYLIKWFTPDIEMDLCGHATLATAHCIISHTNENRKKINFESIILPKKTIFQLCSLLDSYEGDVKISNVKSKIKFELDNSILISKLIDGKFPNYIQVIPKNNQKKLEIDLKSFLGSVDRVASVSLDKKDGVKFNLTKDALNLSVNNTNSGDGNETLSVKFDHDLEISFNSRYLIDVASQLDGEKIEIYFNDTGSPALIKDPSDFDSIYVVMPMKG